MLLADHIAVDAGGKINALGLGFSVTSVVQQPGNLTAPMYVAFMIDFPSRMAGSQVPITIELRDETTDTLVTMPDGNALRVQQLASVQRLQVPGLHLPDDLPCRFQSVMGFPNGLGLTSGHRYAWKLEIDGTRLKGWQAHFYVVAPPPGPIVGGPAGPASIPHIQMPPAEQDDEIDEAT